MAKFEGDWFEPDIKEEIDYESRQTYTEEEANEAMESMTAERDKLSALLQERQKDAMISSEDVKEEIIKHWSAL